MPEGEQLDPKTQFRQLYDQEFTSVYRAIRAVVLDSAAAEDLTQETFVRAYRARNRYTPTAPPGAWLRRIGVNLNQAVAKLNVTGQRSGDLLPYAAESLRRVHQLDQAADELRRQLRQ